MKNILNRYLFGHFSTFQFKRNLSHQTSIVAWNNSSTQKTQCQIDF